MKDSVNNPADSPAVDPVQEQLILARKNQILEAAAKTFSEKGFHPTTIKDIAREAGIADGTIYNYFKNKTALLLGIFDRMQTTIQADAMPDSLDIDDMDLRTFMRLFLEQPLVALREDNFELFRVVVSEMMVNEELRTLYHERILAPAITFGEQMLQALTDQGKIKPIDIGLTVRAISGMIMGLIIESIMDDPYLNERWDTLPDHLTALLLDGMES